MLQKIPFSSIKNPPTSESDQTKLICSLCDGILYEPIFSINNRLNYCKTCFLDKNNTSTNNNKSYKSCSKEIKINLNLYKYTCPNFDFEEKEYTYDQLINHLITCDNNKINCPFCGSETFLKNIEKNEKQKLTNELIKNKILERELEYQKSIIMEMEKEKKQTKIIKEKSKKIFENNAQKNKKEKKEKIVINMKNNSSKKLLVKPIRPFSKIIQVKKGELPPIRRKNKIYTKKDEPAPKLNFNKKLSIKEKPKEIIIDNSKNTTLFDKCPHFYGNYMPKFACCNKFYGCYLCHNENEDHIYQFSNKVACLFCKNVYAGKTCTKCKANQIFKRKQL